MALYLIMPSLAIAANFSGNRAHFWGYYMIGYRFRFNGKENDKETYGDGNALDFGARIYDSRLGRFLSVDPHKMNYPNFSTFAAFTDNPILFVDKDGRDIEFSTIINNDGSKTVFVTMNAVILNQSSNKKHPSDMAAIKSEIERTAKETFSKSFTGPDGKAVNVNFTLKLTEISNTEMIKTNDHVIVLVDKINSQSNGAQPDGITQLNGNVALVKSGLSLENIGRIATHEIAHDLGIQDEYKIKDGKLIANNPNNLMGVGSSTETTNSQRSTMFYRYAAVGSEIKSIWRNAIRKTGDTKIEAKKFIKDEATSK
jgi:RHS repeat-associated protein